MTRVQCKQTLKLRILAIVLALALIWYSLNPLPSPIIHTKREVEPPGEKKRNIESQIIPATLAAFRPIGEIAEASTYTNEDMDDFEWPEFIDG